MHNYSDCFEESGKIPGSFSISWEQRKLGDNIVEYTEKTTENNQYPVLTSSRKGIFFQTDYYDGNQIASADNTGYNIVPYGYFTYRHMSDDEIFHFNINDIAENGIVSTLYPVFTTDENLDSRYLQYQLNYGREFARYAILQKQGGSRTYMYLNKLRNLYLTVPTAIEEQKKISEYFTNLDHLITLHQRKYDKLQNLKKAMLEKMFPKNGSNVPEIRFKGFTDDWEQRKLGELALFNPKDELPQTFEYVDLESVVGTEMLSHRTEVKSFAPSRAQRLAHTGDLFYQTVRPYQKNNYLFEKPDNNYVFSTGYAQMRPYVDGYFLLSLVQSERFVKVVLDNCTGTSYPAINANDLAEIEVAAPSDESEVQKIGTIFRSIDNLTTLHQRKQCILYIMKKLLCGKSKQLEKSIFWEQRKLLDCIQKITDFRGRTPKKLGMDWSEEGYLALSAFNVKDGYIDFNQDVHYGNQELYDKWMAGNELHKGQVLFTTEAPMGNVAQVPDNRRYILSQRTIAFDVKDKLITENFLATVLRTPTVFADLTALSSGGTAKGVSQKSLASVEIRLPKDLNEQEKIADTFFNLDHLITLHQRKP